MMSRDPARGARTHLLYTPSSLRLRRRARASPGRSRLAAPREVVDVGGDTCLIVDLATRRLRAVDSSPRRTGDQDDARRKRSGQDQRHGQLTDPGGRTTQTTVPTSARASTAGVFFQVEVARRRRTRQRMPVDRGKMYVLGLFPIDRPGCRTPCRDGPLNVVAMQSSKGHCCIERSAGGAAGNLPVGHPDRECDAASKGSPRTHPPLRATSP